MLTKTTNQRIYEFTPEWFSDLSPVRMARLETILSIYLDEKLPHDCIEKAVFDKQWQTWKFWLNETYYIAITHERIMTIANSLVKGIYSRHN